MSEVKYGRFWRRLLAFTIDNILRVIAVLPMYFLVEKISSPITQLIALVFGLIIYLGYGPYFVWKRSTTPGKELLGLIIVDNANLPVTSLRTAISREFLGKDIVDRITLQLGNLLIIFDPKKQALHDKIAETYVVHKASFGK